MRQAWTFKPIKRTVVYMRDEGTEWRQKRQKEVKWADSGEIQEIKLSRLGDGFDLYVRKSKVSQMDP